MTLYKLDFFGFLLSWNWLIWCFSLIIFTGIASEGSWQGSQRYMLSFESFWIFTTFTKFWEMTLALKTGFLNPRWKLTVQDEIFRRNTLKIIPLACWALIDLQRHDLEDKFDLNPRPKNFDLKTKTSNLEQFNDWNNLIQRCQEGDKDTSSSIMVMACLTECKEWHWWDTYLCKCKELWSLMEGY